MAAYRFRFSAGTETTLSPFPFRSPVQPRAHPRELRRSRPLTRGYRVASARPRGRLRARLPPESGDASDRIPRVRLLVRDDALECARGEEAKLELGTAVATDIAESVDERARRGGVLVAVVEVPPERRTGVSRFRVGTVTYRERLAVSERASGPIRYVSDSAGQTVAAATGSASTTAATAVPNARTPST